MRSFITIAAVAAISGGLNHWESAQAERNPSLKWVRTVDGWESSSALNSQQQGADSPSLHPALVAGFQLGASLFVLMAFPHQQKKKTHLARRKTAGQARSLSVRS